MKTNKHNKHNKHNKLTKSKRVNKANKANNKIRGGANHGPDYQTFDGKTYDTNTEEGINAHDKAIRNYHENIIEKPAENKPAKNKPAKNKPAEDEDEVPNKKWMPPILWGFAGIASIAGGVYWAIIIINKKN